MKKLYSLFMCIVLLCVMTQLTFPEGEESPDYEETLPPDYNDAASEPDAAEPEGKRNTLKSGLIATGETLLVNTVLLTYNVIALKGQYWAIPNYYSIHRNFAEDWDWERGDGFVVNQFGHPYQGSAYFNAGRVNGFSFYESIFFNVLGSFSWEAFGEAGHASMNDFITTITGPIPIGEMLYRLYVEACDAGVPSPLAALISPVAGFHRLVTDWEPPNYGRKNYHFEAFLGTGFAETKYSTSEDWDQDVFSFRGILTELGVFIIYGNPFLQESRIPYEHFELYFHAGFNPGNYLNLRLLSDGYLLSFCPLDTDNNMMSTGPTLHFDFTSQGEMAGNYTTIDQYSYAVDWTVKYQHLFSEDFSFQIKLHAGFTLMGVGVYYSPYQNDHHTNNYGIGFNEKCAVVLDHKALGKLDMRIMHYIIWSYQNHAVNDSSSGKFNWLFTDITYSHLITKHLSVGITGSFAWEWGAFGNYPDTRKTNREVKVFLAWNM